MKQSSIIKLTLFVTLFISNSIYGQNLTAFESILKDCGMSINIPSGFVESKIVENKDMNYEYAIKYPDKNFELRYAIRPILQKAYANDSVKKTLESSKTFRNSSYSTILKAVILNLTGGVDYEFKTFDKAAVKDEFNADWGAITLVELKSTFGKGFKYCMIVALHKDDVADAYYFYLANAQEVFPENMKPLFHTLRFE